MRTGMITDLRKPFLRSVFALFFSANLFLHSPAFAEGPFAPFVGEWRGDGVVTTSDGQQAPLRCKVEILAEVGERASQALRCASTGAVIVINSSMRLELQDEEKVLVGSWSNDRGNAGGLTGKIADNSVDVMLAGEEIEAQMTSTIEGCKLTVAIEGQLGKIANLQVNLEQGC